MTSLPAILLAVFACCLSGMAIAGTSAPLPFARLSADESRILVVRLEGENHGFSEKAVEWPVLSNGERVEFLRDFPTSGVYTLSDRKLVYAIDWFTLGEYVLASADLRHIALLNFRGKPWALKFFTDGKETATYTLDQLLKAFAGERFRPYETWDWYFRWHEKFELRGNTVILTTVPREVAEYPLHYHEAYEFDLATGAMIRGDNRLVALLVIVVGFSLATGIVLLVKWRRGKRQGAAENGE